MTSTIKHFIEDNIDLIDDEEFEALYDKAENNFYRDSDLDGLTRTLHSCGIYPEFKLKWLPLSYIDIKNEFEKHMDAHPILLSHLANRDENHKAVKAAKAYMLKKNTEATYNVPNPPAFIYNKKTASSYQYARDYVVEVIVDDSTSTVGEFAFVKSPKLKKVHLGKKVKKIGAEAFCGCISLIDINFPDTLESIGKNAFYQTALTEVILPSSVQYVWEGAFRMSNIKKIRFSPAQKVIEEFTCASCSNLEEVIIPGGIDVIKFNAFNGCVSLSKVDLPDTLKTISESAFRSCASLTSINTKQVGRICGNAFDYCMSLVDVEIPNVVSISQRAFAYCTALREIIIPKTCVSVGQDAFADCNRSLVVYYYPEVAKSWNKNWNKGIATIPIGEDTHDI